ncbi:MAG: sigma-70 family RNA polymerase sigma factor [Planctomycetota bacterium]
MALQQIEQPQRNVAIPWDPIRWECWLIGQLPWMRHWAERRLRQAGIAPDEPGPGGSEAAGPTLEDSSDLLQEVWLVALEAHGRAALPSPELAAVWLRLTADEVALARLDRDRNPLASRRDIDELSLTGREPEPWRQLFGCERQSLLEQALERLPGRQRNVVLNDLDGRFDTLATARALGCSPNAVRLLRSRAHRRLRELLLCLAPSVALD